MRALALLAVLAVTGCAVEAAPTAPAPETTGGMEHPAAPVIAGDAAPVADVVWYRLDPKCAGSLYPLGLAAHGTHPTVARDNDGTTYPVTGVYEGAVYVNVGDAGQDCGIGGDYDGYDLFTLDTGAAKR